MTTETQGAPKSLVEGYRAVAGVHAIDVLERLAKALRGHRVVMVNSTAVGGGVAEILHRLVRLFQELDIPVTWEVMPGDTRFYAITKALHNALHGVPAELTASDRDHFMDVSRQAAKTLALDGDLIMIHDPQPAALASLRRKPGQHWVWRCHIDLSHRTPQAWDFLEPHLLYYDAAICSHQDFASGLPIPGFLAAPSIDPLSDKNRTIEDDEIDRLLEPFALPPTVPLVTQVSRFDRLKDPVGVVDAFRLVRKRTRAHLLLAGGSADDDPEGAQVLEEVKQRVGNSKDVTLLALPPDSHLQINAIQRRSTVVVQKSLREGFALTVSEALWKERAVVASAVGGIPLQILHGRTGLLVRSIEGCALQVLRLLHGPALRRRLGRAGHDHVRAHFLHPREGRDYLALFLHLLRRESAVKAAG